MLSLATPVFAADKPADTKTAQVASTSSGAQGYAADSLLQIGTIVQLDEKDNHKVAPATDKKAQQTYGVVVDPHLLSLTISNDSLKNEVFVATSGNFNVLVSTQSGAIKAGDYVAISSIDGVGMRAGDKGVTVLGRAVKTFDGISDVVGSVPLKTNGGQTVKTVSLGIIPVSINVQRNPNEKSTKANLPNMLQRIGQAVADKPVSPAKIYLSAAITLMTIIVTVVMLYAGIRSGIISLGRNPLSKKSILRGLLQVVIASLVILIIGLFAVYLLLKL